VLDKTAVAYDIVYRHSTPFLEAARRAALRFEGGLGMLVRQGTLAQELWLGRSAAHDVMREAAVRFLAAT
jgi:shikimate 5-dehydrogenase